MKVLVYSTFGFIRRFLEQANQGKHELIFIEDRLNKETAILSKSFEGISVFSLDKADEQVLKILNQFGVKFISTRSVGYDHIDIKKANELGIKVANVPAYSPYAIAEHTVALLLALNRKIVQGQKLLHQNDFRLDNLIGYDLHGKTVGIIGTGNIGSAFARIMNGFGCRLLAYDIEPNEILQNEISLTYTSLEDVCKHSDIVSISCPLNENTQYMLNKEIFSIMKKGAVLLNTARGGIVNTLDLIAALDEGIISAAGLDVYEYEAEFFFYDHSKTGIDDDLFLKLRSYPNVLITGHQGFLTYEALNGISKTTIANIDQWEAQGYSENDII